jgi:hypothetical protein
MFDWVLPEKHAIAILKDHDAVKGLLMISRKLRRRPPKRKSSTSRSRRSRSTRSSRR